MDKSYAYSFSIDAVKKFIWNKPSIQQRSTMIGVALNNREIGLIEVTLDQGVFKFNSEDFRFIVDNNSALCIFTNDKIETIELPLTLVFWHDTTYSLPVETIGISNSDLDDFRSILEEAATELLTKKILALEEESENGLSKHTQASVFISSYVSEEDGPLHILKQKATLLGYREALNNVYITVFTELGDSVLWVVPEILKDKESVRLSTSETKFRFIVLKVDHNVATNFVIEDDYVKFNVPVMGNPTYIEFPIGAMNKIGNSTETTVLTQIFPSWFSDKVKEKLKRLNTPPTSKKAGLTLVK